MAIDTDGAGYERAPELTSRNDPDVYPNSTPPPDVAMRDDEPTRREGIGADVCAPEPMDVDTAAIAPSAQRAIGTTDADVERVPDSNPDSNSDNSAYGANVERETRASTAALAPDALAATAPSRSLAAISPLGGTRVRSTTPDFDPDSRSTASSSPTSANALAYEPALANADVRVQVRAPHDPNAPSKPLSEPGEISPRDSERLDNVLISTPNVSTSAPVDARVRAGIDDTPRSTTRSRSPAPELPPLSDTPPDASALASSGSRRAASREYPEPQRDATRYLRVRESRPRYDHDIITDPSATITPTRAMPPLPEVASRAHDARIRLNAAPATSNSDIAPSSAAIKHEQEDFPPDLLPEICPSERSVSRVAQRVSGVRTHDGEDAVRRDSLPQDPDAPESYYRLDRGVLSIFRGYRKHLGPRQFRLAFRNGRFPFLRNTHTTLL
ncbi:hypothetical protein CERSUDRAFT_101079 [Gelatoporia subvermispora B]|uniref:Uncharacterized protein n=1 Tax=Ceriporiopsis subvermispora (strain B) TaxID=914234 RepID=M2QF97_CERS8|nr:hypothetical protein CERSUDRAFT_101079 [Gelatoporia subvermispora B]